MPKPVKISNRKKKKQNKSSKSNGNAPSSSLASEPIRSWHPGMYKLNDDEVLECDPSSYNCLHSFRAEWSCLSFDILRDSLGLIRTEFPHTVYLVAGTQATKASSNYIVVFKVSNISGRRREVVSSKKENEDEESDSDTESDSEDDEFGEDSRKRIVQVRKVAHQGCINRIRSMPQNPHICASWSEFGHVQIWDFSSHLNALSQSPSDSNVDSVVYNQPPLAVHGGHKIEGYGLDWNSRVPGKLVSGDCNKFIHLWEASSGSSWSGDKNPFVGHSSSVEDLQWSPTEDTVFASCSADKTIAIWDTRKGKSPAFQFEAHEADVNVISWNRLASVMLASGSDDGKFSIRDLRQISSGGDRSRVAHFEYHKEPITSIEWSPHEASSLAVSSADNQLTVWDLSLEKDEEEETEFKMQSGDHVKDPLDLPPQLLFDHHGQKDLKEIHWHCQIPGMIISTALDDFNILMPYNIQSFLPPASTS